MTSQSTTQTRYSSLDGLRGIAAAVVVLHHCLLSFPSWNRAVSSGPSGWATGLLTWTPLHLLWAGRAAVVVFFALSGFVLATMLTRPPRISYPAFVVKRICRIYLPYIAIFFLALPLVAIFHGEAVAALSPWFNSSWSGEISGRLIIDHLFMLGNANYNYVDNPMWSLVHEIRFSLVFPVILLLVRKLPASIALAGSLFGSLLFRFAWDRWPSNTVFDSLQYMFVFSAGAVIAIHRESIRKWLGERKPKFHYALLGTALALLSVDGLVFLPSRLMRGSVFVAIQIGSVLLLTCIVGRPGGFRLLESRAAQWLGKFSYCLNLTHLIVVLALIHTLDGVASPTVVMLGAPWAAVFVAVAVHRWIENPAMAFGKALERRIDLAMPRPSGIAALAAARNVALAGAQVP